MRIQETTEHTIEIERSVFICYLFRVFSSEQAKEKITAVKKQHPDATHHCYAFIIGNDTARSNDDGEPSGTAGIPILETLKKMGLEDCLAVVVRYFGGIKLGAGGLIRAYSRSVKEAVQHADLVTIEPRLQYSLTFSYDLIGKLEHALVDKATIINKEYGEFVTYTYLCSAPLDDRIQELTAGRYRPQYIQTIETEVPCLLSETE